ncbi:hypothetical protein GGS23DRAFT_601033 [Durotheca rogersii]|uniref:uncharacterized protein n=1 Tax=Durotheca rogersii TaxID=419775 RepID=UPI00221E4133|nr:uncharacterized protein GGS23DRAFT_601033 [Durotheca rogersii]KAI5856769.1 hypothetical protein GGS23DRAFT_601033 [Durotheca rogersii]
MGALRKQGKQRHGQTCPSPPSTSQPRVPDATGSSPVPPPRTKRVQVSRACQRCRKLQKACSNLRPCLRCARADLADECSGVAPRPSKQSQVRSASGASGADALPASGRTLLIGPAATPALANPAGLPTSPQTFVSFPRESFERKAGLLPHQVVDYCSRRFFEDLAPTIPILTPEYVGILKTRAASESGSEAYCVLLGVCAMVILQVEKTGAQSWGQSMVVEDNAAYGWLLLEEALAAHRHLTRKSSPSLDSVLLVFFIYACHAILFHHSQAFFFIREATTLLLLIKPEDMDTLSQMLAERLFWVLLISERSHAIRYRRPSTLQVTSLSPSLPSSDNEANNSLAGFRCLAALFQSLDTTFIALLNQEVLSRPLPADALDGVEIAINTALNHSSPDSLHPTQKANLRITQLWLRIILWQLRLRLGHLVDQGPLPSRTYRYPLEVAKDLTLSTRDLPVVSVQVHGVGITEKVFDVACAVINVLAGVPVEITETAAEEDLRYIRKLMQQLPGGSTVYDALLAKHIQQTLPDMLAALEI